MPSAGPTTEDWRDRATSAAEAVSAIRPGDRVFVGTACATPRSLVDALEQRADPPAGVVLTHVLTDGVGSGDTRYMVDPEWQGAGLATLLHARMTEYARARGVRGFVAEMLARNTAMLRVFRRGDHRTDIDSADGSREVTMLFDDRRPG